MLGGQNRPPGLRVVRPLVTGGLNRLAAFAFARLLPRRMSVRIMERATRRLYE
jgi:hypothetical protein